jgi:uncharacterized metal-binding protein
MTDKNDACTCKGGTTLIFPCSGGSDVGEISDRTARAMTAEGKGKMFCLAGIGARVSGIMETTRAAEKLLAIDGCPVECARKTLEGAGFQQVISMRINDSGLKKGSSPATSENVQSMVSKACALLCI